MALHRLMGITLGVPKLDETRAFYRDFGLTETAPGVFDTEQGGSQLSLVAAPRRRLVEIRIAAESPDDLGAIHARLSALRLDSRLANDELEATEPGSGVRAVVQVSRPASQSPFGARSFNGPGATIRRDQRAAAVMPGTAPRPRRLGHVVIGCPDAELTRRFFVEGIGMKISDRIADLGASFLRCSQDHHNLLVQPSPVPFLHHTAWEMGDVDEVGQAAARLLEARPDCHVWGLGRHGLGSNFFWYLRDPSGGFNEYYSDLDVIADEEAWAMASTMQPHPLAAWGPPVPMEFLMPPDLGEMASAGQG